MFVANLGNAKSIDYFYIHTIVRHIWIHTIS